MVSDSMINRMQFDFSFIPSSEMTDFTKVGDKRATQLFHGFCSSDLFESSPHVQQELQNRTAGVKRKKRKSRKHQRVLCHRALLEQRKQLSTKEETEKGSDSVVLKRLANRSDLQLDRSLHIQSDCRCPTASISSNLLVEKHRLRRFNKLKKALATSLPVPAKRADALLPNIHGYDSGLSMPGSSASSRPSSPCPPRTSPAKCVAIDCEMVGTGPGGKVSELARCSVVNYAGDVIYDKYIMPEMPIFDYRTRWSGITQQDMKDAIPFIIARKEITAILKDKLVIGHALHHDFQVLKYFHPSIQTRDTSKMPLLNQKAGLPVKATVSLKTLALQLLHKRIQVGKEGHSSVEDAFAAMELYRLIEDQWEQDIMGNFPCQAAVETSDNEEFMEDKYWPEELNGNYTQR
ncbi:apoptosis-enhancing nuclease-like [Ambystoma mexicanum]|uniref:apoptosis-enhancing nuclease-like n=1 Tax=Ambystoma mexicanum TaxID=8296 RepID=UPI0037E8CCB7